MRQVYKFIEGSRFRPRLGSNQTLFLASISILMLFEALAFEIVTNSMGDLTLSAGRMSTSSGTSPDEEYFAFETVASTSKNEISLLSIKAPVCPPLTVVNPYIGGKVFVDRDQDGARTPDIDFAVPNVTVSVYDDNGLVGTTVSSPDGDYLFESAALLPGTTYRIEFTDYPTDYTPSAFGIHDGTSVQFTVPNSCGVDFMLANVGLYLDASPTVVTNCYLTSSNLTDPGDVLISFDFNNPSAIGHEARGQDIGTTFGLAYSKQSRDVFAAAFQKRFAGYGPGSPGSIYIIEDPADGNYAASLFVDLNTLFGSDVAGTDPHDFTVVDVDPGPATVNEVLDGASFNMVGRMSFGDMEITTDGDTLWVVNLNDRSLYGIPLGPDPANPVAPATSAEVEVVPIVGALPDLPAAIVDFSQEIRPFALKYHKGKLYVGIVSNGEVGGLNAMFALAYVYDPAAGTFSKVLEFPLNYARGSAFSSNSISAGPADWNPWLTTNNMPIIMSVPAGRLFVENGHPQPIFSDIEFDSNDNMVIGLRDRFGDQGAFRAANPDGAPTRNENGLFIGNSSNGSIWYTADNDAFGDILLATPSGGMWAVNIADFTDSSQSFSTSTAGVQIPCPDGENFFGEDCYHADGFLHEETAMGGLALNLLNNQVVTVNMDPEIAAFSNGADFFDMNTGNLLRAFSILTGAGNSVFGKGNGLGDMELVYNAAPIEIGNYIWWDPDKDGIQDPSESGIPNLPLELWLDPNGNTQGGNPADGDEIKLAETSTDANGQYLFSYHGNPNSPVAEDWDCADCYTGPNDDNAVQPQRFYQVRLPDWATQPSLTALDIFPVLSPNFNDATTNGDIRDNNAYDNPGTAAIAVATGDQGDNDHTFDMAFSPADPSGFIYCVENGQIITGGTINVTGPGAINIVEDGTNGYYQFFTDGTPGTYTISYTPPAGLQLYTGADRVQAVPYEPMGPDNPNEIGSNTADTLFLDDFSAAANPYYTQFELEVGDPDVALNNIPLNCSVTVGDYVWLDVDEDGFQTGGEPGLQNATVTIYDNATGTSVATDFAGDPYTATQMTDAMGNYLFEALPPGNYYVVFDISTLDNPELYAFTAQNNDGNVSDETDSDAAVVGANIGQTAPTGNLLAGESDLTLDAGVICNISAAAGADASICSTREIDLSSLGATITPLSLGGTWTTTGSGTFDDTGTGNGGFGTATTYTPSTADIASGQITLILTTDDPADLVPPSICNSASDEVIITILNVSCGNFPWGGND